MSEFGAGLVVCLAKFSEHLSNHWMEEARAHEEWRRMSPEERERRQDEARRFPHGAAAGRMYHITPFDPKRTPEQNISQAIELWANGASDHFYDLDRVRAPVPLIVLADLTLEMGHGWTGKALTWDHVKEIHRLWQEACLALDEKLGTKADWGRY